MAQHGSWLFSPLNFLQAAKYANEPQGASSFPLTEQQQQTTGHGAGVAGAALAREQPGNAT